MADLVVSIVSWNTKDLLKACLASIYDNTIDLDYEVWVVDNNSQDGSVAMVEKYFPQVTVIENKENLGFSRANNQVLRRGEGTYFLLLNSDTLVKGNALGELVDFMDANPEAGAAGGKVLNEDGSIQLSGGRFPVLRSIFFGGEICNKLFRKLFPGRKFFAEYGLSEEEHLSVQEIDFAKGCFLMVRTSALEKAGLLDENMFMYFEEIDLCYRIKRQGDKVLYTPVPCVVHLGGRSDRTTSRAVYRQLISQDYFFRKHHGSGYAYAVKWVVGVGALLRLGVFLLACGLARKEQRPALTYRVRWNAYSLAWFISSLTGARRKTAANPQRTFHR